MGLTGILGIDNRSSWPVELADIETGAIYTAPPGQITSGLGVNVPWATSAADFGAHRLELRLGGVTTYWIWQAQMADGDAVRFTCGENQLDHTIRNADGTWTGAGDVGGQITVPGPVRAVAGTNGAIGEAQFMFATADGLLWHTIRQASNTWAATVEVNTKIRVPGPVRVIGAASSAVGESQFMFATAGGGLWHTTRDPDGTWTPTGDVSGQIAVPGAVVAIAATSAATGQAEFMFATAGGGLWHTVRDAVGTWTPTGDVSGQIAVAGPVQAVAAASAAGAAEFMFATTNGHLWHTIRGTAGIWTATGDVNAQLALSGGARTVAAAGTVGVAQFMFTTRVGDWQDPGAAVHGISAPGVNPIFLEQGDRTLVVRDGGFELVDLPGGLNALVSSLLGPGGYRRISVAGTRTSIASVPKYMASSFSMAGPPSDALAAGTPGARFLYRDEGKRYQFTIVAGVVTATGPDGAAIVLSQAVSYSGSRAAQSIPLPRFDLIAANGGRVFAKEQGTDRFFFATMDEMFVHCSDLGDEFAVPSTYFKVDPEFNQPGAVPAQITAPFEGSFAGHPATDRFPLFQLALGLGVVDMMMVRVQSRVWHLIDVVPPLGTFSAEAIGWQEIFTNTPALSQYLTAVPLLFLLAAATKTAADWALPTGVPGYDLQGYDHVTYAFQGSTQVIRSIDFTKVLDIGVGHAHWYEQYESVTGGEVQPMFTGPFLPVIDLTYADLYSFMNGPAADGDGFIDGTCNYYILVQLAAGGYALLFIDEQSYFTQRWRLAEPADFHGMMTALITGLNSDPGLYGWDPAQFWSPFAAGAIAATSRMAVSRQVVMVTAPEPPAPGTTTPGAVIYSINFSYATIDHSWRWRQMPPGTTTVYFPDAAAAAAETIAAQTPTSVYPQTIRLREDMTINVKGTSPNPGGGVDVGRWYQRYLPATNQHPALPSPPTGQRPPTPYTHPWKFLPEAVYQVADKFSHFGVYAAVDARTHFYSVSPVSATDTAVLDSAPDTQPWVDTQHALCTRLLRFWWAAPLRLPDIDITRSIGGLQVVGPEKCPPSLVNAFTQLRIVPCGVGWIAMQWDKRDDDLLGFDGLPVTVRLTNGSQTVNVTLSDYGTIDYPPQVTSAGLSRASATGPVTIMLAGIRNVEQVHMAALNQVPAGITPVTGLFTFPLTNFTTTGGDPRSSGDPIGARFDTAEYQFQPTTGQNASLTKFCSPAGARLYAPSMWLEDALGHVSTPEQLTLTGFS
jgi:hypothetical protein